MEMIDIELETRPLQDILNTESSRTASAPAQQHAKQHRRTPGVVITSSGKEHNQYE
jgi:hypothetical protein